MDAMTFPDWISWIKVWHPNHIFGNARLSSIKTAKTSIHEYSGAHISYVSVAGAHNRRYLQLHFYRCFTAKLDEYSLNVSEQLLLKNDTYP